MTAPPPAGVVEARRNAGRKEMVVAYVVAAKWRAHPHKAERLLKVVQELTPHSRAEPGCLFYQAQRSADDPTLFLIYEQYVDEAGFTAHQNTEHFQRLVRQEVVPELLADRELERYLTVDDPAAPAS